MNKILLVPGLHNSGPDHWQSRWHQYFPHWQRMVGLPWDKPDLTVWSAKLASKLGDLGPAPWLPLLAMGAALMLINALLRRAPLTAIFCSLAVGWLIYSSWICVRLNDMRTPEGVMALAAAVTFFAVSAVLAYRSIDVITQNNISINNTLQTINLIKDLNRELVAAESKVTQLSKDLAAAAKSLSDKEAASMPIGALLRRARSKK